MADEDQDLGETEQHEPFELTPADRRLVTQAYDLSVSTLVEQWTDRLLIVPDFQREYIWDNGKASRLVESLLIGMPIPVLYLYETPDAKYEIIDGHQRIRSIARYINNEFALTSLKVLDQFRNKRFHQLPEREQRFLRTRVIRAIIVGYESAPLIKFEIFGRLNTGAMMLNAQEIRNALYGGSLNELLKELERVATFRQAIGSSNPRPRMVDRELVLRFIGLRVTAGTYKPPLLKTLNDYAKDNRNPSEDELGSLRAIFELASARVFELFGPAAFRLTDADGKPVDRNVNRALFDAQMLTCSWIPPRYPLAQLQDLRPQILTSLRALYDDDLFLDSIQRATGDRSRFRRRVSRYAAAFAATGVPVALPTFID
jgi:hypothetical protein